MYMYMDIALFKCCSTYSETFIFLFPLSFCMFLFFLYTADSNQKTPNRSFLLCGFCCLAKRRETENTGPDA